ncbi:MAG TPA: hypothetical protein VFE91_06275 [Nitrososphaerales archaeon]|nr:hypothetical protein [Nitrososphaerales archaeon]
MLVSPQSCRTLAAVQLDSSHGRSFPPVVNVAVVVVEVHDVLELNVHAVDFRTVVVLLTRVVVEWTVHFVLNAQSPLGTFS